MNKVLKVLSLSFLLCLSLVVAPFHISANASLSAPFIGYNIYIYDTDSDRLITNYSVDLDTSGFQMTCSNMQSSGGCMTYKQTSNEDTTGYIRLSGSGNVVTHTTLLIELILDDDYVGYVNMTHSNQSKNYYVNGNKLQIYTQYEGQTITINNYLLTKVDNNNIMWMFPIESYTTIDYIINQGFEMSDFYSDQKYMFPIFKTNTTGYIGRAAVGANSNDEWIMIIGMSNPYITNLTRFDTLFSYTEGIEWYDLRTLYVSGTYRIISVKFRNPTSSNIVNWVKYKNDTDYIMPIYFNRVNYDNLGTDFALTYGLNNRLLNNLDIIANGTDSSASSQSDLAQSTDDLTQSSNQLVTQEDAFNNDMNSALQNVNTNFNFGSNFGSKFIASADWVKTQYDRLTGSTPFGSVISFSLLIGLALLLVGKVFK